MKTVEINYIDFDTNDQAMKNENYPCNGLFMTKIKNGNSDLRFVDKNVEINFCIAPEVLCNNILTITQKHIEPEETPVQENKYNGDFILEFSRILLNRK